MLLRNGFRIRRGYKPGDTDIPGKDESAGKVAIQQPTENPTENPTEIMVGSTAKGSLFSQFMPVSFSKCTFGGISGGILGGL